MLPGVYTATKKNGEIYYRSSVTFHQKHISLGSYSTEEDASSCYSQALSILNSSITLDECLSSQYLNESCLDFSRIISLINFRDNRVYFKNPIYLYKKYFHYYISATEHLIFDAEDLFYYGSHRIQRRQNHLFIADYGMQISLNSRYGIKPYAIHGRDYEFLNGDILDYRYENIKIYSRYNGVLPEPSAISFTYKAVIHFKGNYTIGRFNDEAKAAIAYNKAADYINSTPYKKNYSLNYIEEYSARTYADIYSEININDFICRFNKQHPH